jgi:ABC-type enterobactin transport system permease subunit
VYRRARTIGLVIAGIGLAVMLGFAGVAAMNVGEVHKAQMVRERNPGNAMYDLQFFIATVRLAFLVTGAVGGALLALNGAVWMSLGGVVRRLEHGPPGRGGGSA